MRVARRPKGITLVRYRGRERHYDRLLGNRPVIVMPYSSDYYAEIAATRAHDIAAKGGKLAELIAAYAFGSGSAKATRAASDHAELWLQEMWACEK
jgi:hypothetical protein